MYENILVLHKLLQDPSIVLVPVPVTCASNCTSSVTSKTLQVVRVANGEPFAKKDSMCGVQVLVL